VGLRAPAVVRLVGALAHCRSLPGYAEMPSTSLGRRPNRSRVLAGLRAGQTAPPWRPNPLGTAQRPRDAPGTGTRRTGAAQPADRTAVERVWTTLLACPVAGWNQWGTSYLKFWQNRTRVRLPGTANLRAVRSPVPTGSTDTQAVDNLWTARGRGDRGGG
jgi:hypothetical protein